MLKRYFWEANDICIIGSLGTETGMLISIVCKETTFIIQSWWLFAIGSRVLLNMSKTYKFVEGEKLDSLFFNSRRQSFCPLTLNKMLSDFELKMIERWKAKLIFCFHFCSFTINRFVHTRFKIQCFRRRFRVGNKLWILSCLAAKL